MASKALFYKQSLKAFHFHSIAHCITMDEVVKDTTWIPFLVWV